MTEQVDFVGVSAVPEATQASMTPAALAGPGVPVQATDYMLAFVNWDANNTGITLTPPAGWTLLEEDTTSGDWRGAVYSAPGSTALGTWTMSAAQFCGMQVWAGRSVDGTPITSKSHVNRQSTTTPILPASMNAQTNDTVVVQYALFNDVTETFTGPAGYTVRSQNLNMLLVDSNGPAPGANLQPSTTPAPTASENLIFAIALRPAGQNGGTLEPTVTTLCAPVGARSNSQPMVNTVAIPAGAYLRLTAGDASFGASAGAVTAVRDNLNGAWELRHQGNNNDGVHWLSQSVWHLPNSKAAAIGDLTITVTGTSNTSGNGGLIAEVIKGVGPSPIDQEGWDDTNLSGDTDEVGQALASVAAGDLVLGSFTTYETDGGFTADGKQLVVAAINPAGSVVPSVSTTMLDGPAEQGTNVLGANYDGPSGGIIMTYIVALKPSAPPPSGAANPPTIGRGPVRRVR